MWIRKNRIEFLILIFILVLTLFLRFYKIDQYMTFLGDEGRDALVIKDILVNKHIPLLGPPTSVGGMYLGPLYYYMMAIPMALFWLNPVVAAGLNALIGTLTVFLIYYLTREWFGKKSAFFASLLYSVSPITIIYSRSSWNPNPAPFFALLAILGVFFAHKKKDFRWFILTGGALAFALQMHYLALILIPIFGLLWLNELRIYRNKNEGRKYFVLGTLFSIVLFLFLMSPLVIFDFRHNFMNYKAITTFFFNNPDKSVEVNIFNNFFRSFEIYQFNLIARYISSQEVLLTWVASFLVLLTLGFAVYKKFKKEKVEWPYLALGLYLGLGVFGLSFYHQQIYDHYLGFLNPVPFILLGGLFSIIVLIKNNQLKKIIKYLYIIFLGILISVNLANSPIRKPPNRQLQKTQEIAKFVIAESQNKPFNFALLSAHNYDAAYQFYLGEYGHKPGMLPFEKYDQLFVVCEDVVCEPVGNSKYEIAAYGWTKLDYEKQIHGVRVFKLISNPDQPKPKV